MEGSSHFVPTSVIAVSVVGLRELVTCVLPANDTQRADVLALQQRSSITLDVMCALPECASTMSVLDNRPSVESQGLLAVKSTSLGASRHDEFGKELSSLGVTLIPSPSRDSMCSRRCTGEAAATRATSSHDSRRASVLRACPLADCGRLRLSLGLHSNPESRYPGPRIQDGSRFSRANLGGDHRLRNPNRFELD